MTKPARGFTLIELLVVIAIIGILSAVVLAALNTARTKGSDAAVKSDLHSIKNQAELYANTNSNSYGTAANCTTAVFTDAQIVKAFADIDKNNGSGSVACYSSPSAYAVSSPLISGGFWCVDAGGKSKAESATLAANQTSCT